MYNPKSISTKTQLNNKNKIMKTFQMRENHQQQYGVFKGSETENGLTIHFSFLVLFNDKWICFIFAMKHCRGSFSFARHM